MTAHQQAAPMLSVSQALARLLAAAEPIQQLEWVATEDAVGRVLAQDQVSSIEVPPADNTQMDGYAVRASDCCRVPVTLAVSQRIPAGHVGTPLAPGTAARIFTGGLIPAGADAVVMQEHTSAADGQVTIEHAPKSGEWIRRRGEDIASGAVILPAGTRLAPQHLGLAASTGLARLPVLRRLRVAVLFTGDELAMPGAVAPADLAPGAIYNSNRFTLRGLLARLGADVTDLGNVPDTLEATRAALRAAADQHDLIITSGGVSVGEEDHVRPAVQAQGRLDLWRIAVKPGKPLAFGALDSAAGSTHFIGLPGNPVSSFVTFLLFVRPFMLRLSGVVQETAPRRFWVRAAFDWPRADPRHEFLRVKLNPAGELELFPNQGSGVLTSTVWGDGLCDNPPGSVIRAGDLVPFIPFSEFDC